MISDIIAIYAIKSNVSNKVSNNKLSSFQTQFQLLLINTINDTLCDFLQGLKCLNSIRQQCETFVERSFRSNWLKQAKQPISLFSD